MENDFGQWLPNARPERLKQFGRSLKPELREELPHHFSGFHAHPGQQPPDGDWRTWLIMAGRGFGKTRAGAEWVRAIAEDGEARIALVAATLGAARSVMVEGESGLLACCPPARRPVYEPSLRKVTFANGAQAFLDGANEPEALRGPQHSHAIEGEADDPPSAPAEGECWLVGDTPTGAWADHAGDVAAYQAGGWIFAAPRDGMRVLDRGSGQDIRYVGGWQRPTAPAEPAGGATVDVEARVAIAELIAALVAGGVLPDI